MFRQPELSADVAKIIVASRFLVRYTAYAKHTLQGLCFILQQIILS